MTSAALFGSFLLLACYVTKRLLDAALGRLSERFADWLFPSERVITYRFALAVIAVCRWIAPNGSPANHACESVRDDIDAIYSEGTGRGHPALLTLSLVRPVLGAASSRLAGGLLRWTLVVALGPSVVVTAGLIMLATLLQRSRARSLKRYRREYWAAIWLGVTVVPVASGCASAVCGVPLNLGLAATGYAFLGAVLGTGMVLFSDPRQVPQRSWERGSSDGCVADSDERAPA